MSKYAFAIFVIEGEQYYESAAALLAQYGKLPETTTLKGPNGSMFYFFRIPDGVPPKRLQLAPGVQLLTDGEYDDVLPTDILEEAQAKFASRPR